MHQAIIQHGWRNFGVEILFDGPCTDDEIDRLERRAIREHGTLVPRGYNKQRGGGRVQPIVTKQDLRAATKLLHVPYHKRGA